MPLLKKINFEFKWRHDITKEIFIFKHLTIKVTGITEKKRFRGV